MNRPVPLCVLLLASLCVAAEEVPLANAGFEQVPTTPKSIPGWLQIRHAGQVAFDMRIDSSVHAVGERSFRIERTADNSYGMIAQTIAAGSLPGRKLEYSARIKTQDIGPRGVVLVMTFMRGENLILEQLRTPAATGTTEWNTVKIQTVVPATTTSIKLGVMLLDAGTAWADDLHLRASDRAPTKGSGKPPGKAKAAATTRS